MVGEKRVLIEVIRNRTGEMGGSNIERRRIAEDSDRGKSTREKLRGRQRQKLLDELRDGMSY